MASLPGPTAGFRLLMSGKNKFLVFTLVIVLSVSTGSIAFSRSPGEREESRHGLIQRFQECIKSGDSRRKEGYFREAILLFSEARDLAQRMDDPEKEVR
ncbi:MAG: hypothetical protein OEW18_06305, partial [Candidatus Aminicenantes bacterium]|nr:hypothetical protein [Candidatus Aminicenantes bacterium]